ncbi:hypothetical protein NDU88_003289 [Pleurodeles waltl]|uniref:Uncharacterized protein n=1 Tax=Pleurodeles waltl TaxID=8319 RepID=A0AAV7VGY8_PLEWA|nr:hypothetical protein NDU88_003289 [Pleurodeles waltl]
MLPPLVVFVGALDYRNQQLKKALWFQSYPRGAAPSVLVSAVQATAWPGQCKGGEASPLVVLRSRGASSLFGIRSRGGHGCKAASTLRLRHLAKTKRRDIQENKRRK